MNINKVRKNLRKLVSTRIIVQKQRKLVKEKKFDDSGYKIDSSWSQNADEINSDVEVDGGK